MKSLHQRLGPQATVDDIVDLYMEDMPQYDPDENELQKVDTFPSLDEEPEVTLKWEEYLHAETLLPRGDKMARGHVVCWKHNSNSKPIGRSNQNSILDTHLYEVEFPGVGIKELAANTNSIYALCDVNGNKYLLFEAFVYHRMNDSVLSVEDHKIVVPKPLERQQLVGIFVVSGGTAPQCRRNHQICIP